MYFSVVIPIHNEAKFLPYSLPSIYQIKPDEVILIFDRCTDNSLEIAKKIASKFCYISRNKFIEFNKETPRWNRRAAFLYRYGYKIAKNDIILTVDADIILDKCVKFYLNMIGKYGIHLISFSWIPFPLTIQFFISKLISLISPKEGSSGIYAFSKQAWLETEDEESVRKIYRAADTHLQISMEKKYRRKHIQTKTIHLRPREGKKDHYIEGVIHWIIINRPLWKEIIYSIIYLKPMMLAGYLRARGLIK